MWGAWDMENCGTECSILWCLKGMLPCDLPLEICIFPNVIVWFETGDNYILYATSHIIWLISWCICPVLYYYFVICFIASSTIFPLQLTLWRKICFCPEKLVHVVPKNWKIFTLFYFFVRSNASSYFIKLKVS